MEGSVRLRHIEPDSDVNKHTKRMHRDPTLDLGAEIEIFGITDADRTLKIIAGDLTEEVHERLVTMVKLYSFLNVSMKDGFYKGAPRDIDYRDGKTLLTILIKEKLSL